MQTRTSWQVLGGPVAASGVVLPPVPPVGAPASWLAEPPGPPALPASLLPALLTHPQPANNRANASAQGTERSIRLLLGRSKRGLAGGRAGAGGRGLSHSSLESIRSSQGPS